MKSRIVLGICVSLLFSGMLLADSRFTGAVNELWSLADNWSAGLPDVADKAQFTADQLCILDYDAGIINNLAMEGGGATHLRLVDGAQLIVRQWSIIGYAGNPDTPHLLEVWGGVLTGGIVGESNGRIFISRSGYAKLDIDYSGVVIQENQPFQVGQGADGNGIVAIRGGSLNLGNNNLIFRAGANSQASMDFSGGVMTQDYTDARLANINDHKTDGTITAYGGVGEVLVDTVDGVLIVKGLHSLNPVPEDGADIVGGGTTTLAWTVDAGTAVDVWFATKPDYSDAQKIVDKQAVTTVAVQVENKQRYFWAVDTYAAGSDDPTFGPSFDFYADNLAPIVKAADDVPTWLENGSVEVGISATVDDVDSTTTLWTVITEPNEGTAVIADATQLDTTVTCTEVGTYVLQIEATDGEKTGSDTMTINVYADHCLAAQSLPEYEVIPGDINGDCIVDDLDLAIMNENWLKCNGLDCPDPNAM
ncbi:hypothetical protein ACFL3F_03400 [Planctomycetota bacterium]